MPKLNLASRMAKLSPPFVLNTKPNLAIPFSVPKLVSNLEIAAISTSNVGNVVVTREEKGGYEKMEFHCTS